MKEVFSHDGRRTAVDAIRDRAAALRREAAGLSALADALDEIQRYSASRSVDGAESDAPYIGVGSAAENALHELVMKASVR